MPFPEEGRVSGGVGYPAVVYHNPQPPYETIKAGSTHPTGMLSCFPKFLPKTTNGFYTFVLNGLFTKFRIDQIESVTLYSKYFIID